ncbi:MAG: RICIN domain-containing protein [Actinomycetota bacterium]|nr:RICIN domain-containing protein [Actinomycetota bacterium]
MRLRTLIFIAGALALVLGDPLLAPAIGAPAPRQAPPTVLNPTPRNQAAAAAAGQQAGQLQRSVQVADTAVPISLSTARVFATQYAPNTPGSVEVAVPDKCAKFAALKNTAALSQFGCPSTYLLGLDYRVVVFADNGKSAVLPVKDVGPWNTDDNFWDFGAGAPRARRLFTDLPAETPESQSAFYNGYNNGANCKNLDGSLSGHAGGADQFGRCVLNPAGIDLSTSAAATLGLAPGQNGWVTVAYLWEPTRNTVTSVNSGKNVDIPGSTANGAAAVQWSPNASPNQMWRFELVTADTYRIASASTGKVLDVANGSTADGSQIIQWPWNGGANQQWRFQPVGENRFNIVSVASGKVLDVAGASQADGAPLILWPSNGGANQQWRLNLIGSG